MAGEGDGDIDVRGLGRQHGHYLPLYIQGQRDFLPILHRGSTEPFQLYLLTT